MGEGEGGTNWESSIETYTLTYLKFDSQWKLAYDAASPNQVCYDNLDGRDGIGGGRKVHQGGDMCIPMADSCWYRTENQHNIIKQLPSN